jgi:hypothetical protein
MPTVSSEVKSYQYEFRAVEGENVALLYLFDDQNRLLSMVAFEERTGPLPGPQENPAGVVFLTYRRSDLPFIIDMLRNEKPVIFTWSREQRVARITTKEEPVGEEESKSLWLFLLEHKKGVRKTKKARRGKK